MCSPGVCIRYRGRLSGSLASFNYFMMQKIDSAQLYEYQLVQPTTFRRDGSNSTARYFFMVSTFCFGVVVMIMPGAHTRIVYILIVQTHLSCEIKKKTGLFTSRVKPRG